MDLIYDVSWNWMLRAWEWAIRWERMIAASSREWFFFYQVNESYLSLLNNGKILFQPEFVSSLFHFAASFNVLALNDTELGLFSAVVLLSADRPGVADIKVIEQHQDRLIEALKVQVRRNRIGRGKIVLLLYGSTKLRSQFPGWFVDRWDEIIQVIHSFSPVFLWNYLNWETSEPNTRHIWTGFASTGNCSDYRLSLPKYLTFQSVRKTYNEKGKSHKNQSFVVSIRQDRNIKLLRCR